MGPFATSAASLPPAWLRALGLFLTGLAGWSGSLVLLGHDPAFGSGARVAGLLTLLGMLLPGRLHEALVARSEHAGELRRVRALMETTRLPVLARGDAPGLRDTRSLPLLAPDLLLPVYEAAIGAPGREGRALAIRAVRRGRRPGPRESPEWTGRARPGAIAATA